MNARDNIARVAAVAPAAIAFSSTIIAQTAAARAEAEMASDMVSKTLPKRIDRSMRLDSTVGVGR